MQSLEECGPGKMCASVATVRLAELMTDLDAAALLRIHPGTLRNWRAKGVGPAFVRVGWAVRYKRDHLEQYLEAQTRRPKRLRISRRCKNLQPTAA